MTSTSDLGTLALSDKEFILQNGTPEDAEKVFATVKGKTVEIPDATVISATSSVLTVAVSDDAVQSKTADFTFNMKEPLKTVPTVGSKVALTGTYTSYSQGGVTAAASTTAALDGGPDNDTRGDYDGCCSATTTASTTTDAASTTTTPASTAPRITCCTGRLWTGHDRHE